MMNLSRSLLMRASLAALFALMLGACSLSSGSTQPRPPADTPTNVAAQSRLLDSSRSVSVSDVGMPAPDFQYTLGDGTTVKLSDLRGKKVAINFWATWCEPCKQEMPDLQKASNDFGDSFVVIGVNKGELTDVIAPFTQQVRVTFPLVVDAEGDIATHYGVVGGIPQTVFINTDGTVGLHHLGPLDYADIKQQIDKLK